MTWPIISDDEEIQRHYERCRHSGTSHTLAEMFAYSQAPQGISDCTFMAGTANGRQFQGNSLAGDRYRQIAESRGQDVTGKKYLSGLAAFPGDPEAWVDSRDDVRKVLEKRGWGCEGSVTVKKRDPICEPKTGPDVADDLLNKYTAQVASQLPDAHRIDLPDLKSQVKERIRPKNRTKTPTKATVE